MEQNLLDRYKRSLDRIGINNLPALPENMRAALKNATALSDKVKVLEAIEEHLSKQGLI